MYLWICSFSWLCVIRHAYLETWRHLVCASKRQDGHDCIVLTHSKHIPVLLGLMEVNQAIAARSLRVRRIYRRDLFRVGKAHMPVVHLSCLDSVTVRASERHFGTLTVSYSGQRKRLRICHHAFDGEMLDCMPWPSLTTKHPITTSLNALLF